MRFILLADAELRRVQDELLRTRMALEDAETARRQAVAGRVEAEAESQQLNDQLEALRRENRSLLARLAELEKPTAPAGRDLERDVEAAEAAAESLRQRVAQLTKELAVGLSGRFDAGHEGECRGRAGVGADADGGVVGAVAAAGEKCGAGANVPSSAAGGAGERGGGGVAAAARGGIGGGAGGGEGGGKGGGGGGDERGGRVGAGAGTRGGAGGGAGGGGGAGARAAARRGVVTGEWGRERRGSVEAAALQRMATAERERPEGEAVALDVLLGESGRGGVEAARNGDASRNDDASQNTDASRNTDATQNTTLTTTIQLQNELAATKQLLQKADQERQMCLEKIAQLQADNQEMAEDLAAKVAVDVETDTHP